MRQHAILIPCLRYENAPAAIDFLCRAFGFERHVVYADDQDSSIIHHAQLTLDNSMIMLCSDLPGPVRDLYRWVTPRDAGGVTMCVCAYVEDPDAHCGRAQAAGAEIIKGPYDNEGYPGRAYDARDPEGHVWNFGSYDPWAE